MSGDAWLLVRGGGRVRQAQRSWLAPTYGASQAGAVLRVPFSPRGFGYVRSSAALGRPERDLALGLAARPAARIPLILSTELRLDHAQAKPRVRPAVGLVTSLRPVRGPGGWVTSAYGQAGWVGGADATVYADGQVRLDHDLLRRGRAQLAAGLAIWAAGQRGARRVDMGPAITVTVPVADRATLRIEANWRQRVAGNALPGSGPALVVATGF